MRVLLLSVSLLLLVGCKSYPYYAPVMMRSTAASPADQKAAEEVDATFDFLGITEKTDLGTDRPPRPVVRVGVSLRNRSATPIRLTFAGFTFVDSGGRHIPTDGAFQRGKLIEQATLEKGQSGYFELNFTLPPSYPWGQTFRVKWAFTQAKSTVKMQTRFAQAPRPVYVQPVPAYYYDPWYGCSYDPFWGPPYPYYYPGPYFGFSYGFHFHGHGHRGKRRHRRHR